MFRFVKFIPLWIAPNLITMVGLMINIITAMIVVAYCPTASEIPPWWTTALCAVGLFVYQVRFPKKNVRGLLYSFK